jgi:hypothetical protein
MDDGLELRHPMMASINIDDPHPETQFPDSADWVWGGRHERKTGH